MARRSKTKYPKDKKRTRKRMKKSKKGSRQKVTKTKKYKKKVLRAGSRKKKTKNRKVKRVAKGGWGGVIKSDELTGGGQWKITSGIISFLK